MSLAAPSPGVLHRHLDQLVDRRSDAVAAAFRCSGWDGPAELEVGARRCRIYWCPSGLAVREVLAQPVVSGELAVVLTDRPDDEIGLDVIARLVRHRVLEIDPWLALRQSFGAVDLDPRLAEHAWLATELLAELPPGGYPRVPAGSLDLDTAWAAFLEHRLGLAEGACDVASMLRWAELPAGAARLRTLAGDTAAKVVERVRSQGGVASAAIARLALAGRETEALPLGLVCRVLYAESPEGAAERTIAAARLEERFGFESLPATEGRRWADAAEALLARRRHQDAESAATEVTAAEIAAAERRGDELLEGLKIAAHAHLSDWLRRGERQRQERLAAAIESALAARPAALGGAIETLTTEVLRHERARPGARPAIETAPRLLRWLAREETAPTSLAAFPEAAARYAAELSWVDLARQTLWSHDPGAPLAEVFRVLLERVQTARETLNRRFGELARGWFEADGSAAGLVPVETVLERVVAPLAAQAPVFLLVLDGLSFAIYRRLLGDLLDRGWEPRCSTEGPQVALAALPSITEVSRCSLLSGRLGTGGQAAERQGFTTHPALAAVALPGFAPLLFHKAGLERDGAGLAEEVRRELGNGRRKIVGLVLNAVDDHLARGGQRTPPWSLETLPLLETLLDAAAAGGRAVVLTADHGHLAETATEVERAEGVGERYRAIAAETVAGEITGEISVRGRRVVHPGGALVAAWSETLRYSRRKTGYHGGISPQELLVPLAVLAQSTTVLAGWQPAPGELPEWWEAAPEGTPATGSPLPAKTRSRRARRPPTPVEQQAVLFEPVFEPPSAPPSTSSPASSDLWSTLAATEVWRQQIERAGGEARAHTERVRVVLELLERHGGRLSLDAAGRALNLGLPRLRAMVSQLQRLLNLDAYPILDLDEIAGELRLDAALLAEQFELGRRR